MSPEIASLDVVALVEDLPAHGLVRGQVGTVVELLAPGVFEVEFSDDEGRSYAMLALKVDQLMVLHHNPVRDLGHSSATTLKAIIRVALPNSACCSGSRRQR